MEGNIRRDGEVSRARFQEMHIVASSWFVDVNCDH